MAEVVDLPAMGVAQQESWRRDHAQIDVLIPEGVGERAAARLGAGGAPTVSAPGATQALTEVAVDRARTRHCTDFVVLAGLISARDFKETELDKKDKKRLDAMIACCRSDDSAMAVGNAAADLDRLERAAKLSDPMMR